MIFVEDQYRYLNEKERYEQVAIHRKANRIGKELIQCQDEQNPRGGCTKNLNKSLNKSCECCQRYVGETPKLTLMTNVEQKYNHYGPNVVIYISLIKKIAILLLALSLIFSIYALISNAQGISCTQIKSNCQSDSTVYRISSYNIFEDMNIRFVQIVLLLCICVTIFFFNIYLRVYCSRKYEKINNANITDADFCILIRKLDEDTQKSDIERLVQEFREDAQPEQLQKSQNLSIHSIFMLRTLKEVLEVHKQNIKQFKKAVKKQQLDQFQSKPLPLPKQFAKAAIVRFNSIHANQIIDISTSVKSRIIQYIFPFINAETKYKVRGKNVSIVRAPEPSDIIWKNFGLDDCRRIKIKLLYWVLAIGCLALSSGILYGLSKGQQAIQDSGSATIGYQIMTIIVLFIFNTIIYSILYFSTIKSRLTTRTQQKIDLLQKTFIFQTINLGFFTILVPFLVQLPDFKQGILSMNLPTVTLITICMQALLWPPINFVLNYLQFYNYIIPKCFVSHNFLRRTHRQTIGLLSPLGIPYVSMYASLAKMLLFACIFSIISPICLPIAAFGMLLNLIFEKILLDQKYGIPEYGMPVLNDQFVDILDFAPLAIALVSLGVNYMSISYSQIEIPGYHFTVLYINLVIGIIIAVFPWTLILKHCKILKIQAENNITFDEDTIKVRYEDYIPFYKKQNRNKERIMSDLQIASNIKKSFILSEIENPQQSQRKLYEKQKYSHPQRKNTRFSETSKQTPNNQKYRTRQNSDF